MSSTPLPVEKVDGHGSRMTTLRCKSILAIGSVLAFLLLPSWIHSQESPHSVNVEVQFDQPQGTISPIWNYFGYDEPNYTYAPNGKKLLGELAALSPLPAYVRVHNLLTTGDGSASLKWGSTNVYTEDAAGKANLQLDDPGPHFRHLPAAGVKAVGRNRFHAGGSVHASRALSSQFSARPHFHRLGLPSQGLSEVVGSGLSICPSPARALWRRGGKNLAVGSLERARHRLLEGNAGGIFQALRLHRGRGPARPSRGSRRRAGQHRPGQSEGGRISCAHSSTTVLTSQTM